MLLTAMLLLLLHAALVSCLSFASGVSAPPPPPRRSPYSSFRSIRPPPGFHVESAPSRRTEDFAEVPKFQDSPGGDFVGHPLDYGSSLNFGGPLATTVGKVKVLDYASRMNGEGGRRYGKPLVKPYESIYASKSQGAQKYTSAAKKPAQQRPSSRAESSVENEIEGSAGEDAKDVAASREASSSSLEDDQLAAPFDFAATSRSGGSEESPFPEAGEMAGFFF